MPKDSSAEKSIGAFHYCRRAYCMAGRARVQNSDCEKEKVDSVSNIMNDKLI